MPPLRKAAKRAAKKAAKKAASHHHDKHHEAKDLRRAYEYTGRVAVLHQNLTSSATDAVADLTALAQQAIKDGHTKNAANLLRASEHLSFAILAGEVSGTVRVSGELKESITEQFDELTRRADEQLRWAEVELQKATQARQNKVLFLHCYPSDLKVGSNEVTCLVRDYEVRLVDMGHTHYNEISNDGRTLYSATCSTGQIEEGPVGYSVTNIDGNVVSWRFVELGKLPIAVITSPSDERLLTKSSEIPQGNLKVRAKFWGEVEALKASVELADQTHAMKRIGDSHVWETDMPVPSEGTHPLKVSFTDVHGEVASDEIWFAVGERTERKSEERDQNNELEPWPEHGLLGTQLGPNKNGKKW